MKDYLEKDPILNFKVVAIHCTTGRPQFAIVSAPSQKDANDLVADMQPEWIIITRG